MATFQNGQRQVINTIEDTSKYQTGDARRLRVHSDPLNIPVAVESSSINQLAQALSAVKPELMNYAIDKKTEEYSAEILKGKGKAQTGGIAEGEMEQYGYDSVKAVNDWTDWNQKVIQEYDLNFDKENGNVEDFLKTQWEAHPFQDKTDTYTSKFTTLASKSMEKIRASQGEFATKLQDTKNNTELMRMFSHDINDVQGAGMDYTATHYEARRANLKAQFPGKTNSQLDELAYEAVANTVEETKDTELLNIFKNPHLDGTPGLYEIPKWKDKLDALAYKVTVESNKAFKDKEIAIEKELKNAADVSERGILFQMIDINTFADPTVRADKLRELVMNTKSLTESGLPISDSTIKLLMTASTGIDKKEETLYQAQNYNKLRLGNPTTAQIARAIEQGDISQSGFEKLMNAKDAEANRAASRADKTEKPITSNPYYKDFTKQIYVNSGYSFGSFDTPNKQAKDNAEAVISVMRDYIEESVASGVSVKEATSKATELGLQRMKDAGISSKGLEGAKEKLNVQSYTEAVKNNTPLPSLTPKEKQRLQQQAIQDAKSKKAIQTHESTK
jgi:hypothetical protein